MKFLQTLRRSTSAKPHRYEIVRCLLADGRKVAGHWTGQRWWSEAGEISPEGWHR